MKTVWFMKVFSLKRSGIFLWCLMFSVLSQHAQSESESQPTLHEAPPPSEKAKTEEEDTSSDTSLVQLFLSGQKRFLEEFFYVQPELIPIKKVFYPFGGSDILYPLSIFPNAQEILLVGLEHIHFTSDEDLHDSFEETPLCEDVSSLIARSFSVSKDMWDNDKHYKEGVFARICDQLRILGVKDMNVSHDSVLNILVISFVYRGIPRKVTYRQTSLSDRKGLPEVLAWVKAQGVEGVVMKATSFCMHQKNFSQMRDFVAKNAQVIVQDDTGIPLKTLEETHTVKKFGVYTRPYGKEWDGYIQQDLREKKAEDSGPLKFFFGYGARKQPCVVLLACSKNMVDTSPSGENSLEDDSRTSED